MSHHRGPAARPPHVFDAGKVTAANRHLHADNDESQVLALRYTPTDEICEVESGICYQVFVTREKAQATIDQMDAKWRGNYEIVPLPAGLTPHFDHEISNDPHDLNIDAAQRELDSRAAQGEDVSTLRVNQRTALVESDRALAESFAGPNPFSAEVLYDGSPESEASLQEIDRGLDAWRHKKDGV